MFFALKQIRAELTAIETGIIPGSPGKVWRRKCRICGASNVVSVLARHRAKKIRGAVDLIDIQHVRVVEKIEGLHAGFRTEAFGDIEDPLQTNITVIIRGSAV